MAIFEGKYVTINEDRAREVFALLAKDWRAKSGIFKDVVFPEDRVTYPDTPKDKANWLFWMAHFMRGGIVSDDAINMFGIMAEDRPEIFDPFYLADAEPQEVIDLIRNANQQRLIYLGKRIDVTVGTLLQSSFSFVREVLIPSNGQPKMGERKSFGRAYRRKTLPRDAGTLGYKLQEHAPNFIHNAQVLCRRFGGDARNLFKTPGGSYVKNFEKFFSQIDYEKNGNDGILGMRRKIAALLQMWFEKFNLIPMGIPCPLVVDFHLLRVLYSTEVVRFKQAKMLEQSTKRSEPYPETLVGKLAVRVTDQMREEVMAWSTKFLRRKKKQYTSSELGMAMWILSRELCPAHAQTKALDNKTRYISYDEIAGNVHLQHAYPSLCGFCPLERHCTGTFSSGPHYEYGLLVLQKRFHYITEHLPGVDLSMHLRPRKSGKDRGARY